MLMKRLIWILTLTIAAIAGGTYYLRADAGDAAPRLSTAAVTRNPIVVTVSATGTLAPVDTVEVGTQVSGTIASLGADFNQTVKRGQVVATLDPAVLTSVVQQADATVIRLNAELERAQVQYEDARIKLGRAEELAVRQLIAAQEVDTARSNARVAEVGARAASAQLSQAQAALEQARLNLSHTVITSPVDGIVLSRNVEVGQTVSAGLQAPTLFVIARSLDTLQLDARVDEADVGQVAAGQPVSFVVDAYAGRTFTGKVRQVRLQPTVAQNVVSYTTVIDVPNPERVLKPGMTATLDIEVARADDALRVPTAALRFKPTDELLAALTIPSSAPSAGREDQATVWVLKDGRLSQVDVRTGLSDIVNVAITAGALHDGDLVVTGIAAQADATSSAPAPTGSPLMPSFPRARSSAGGGARNGAGGR
jgi:HlyD family secretion protein